MNTVTESSEPTPPAGEPGSEPAVPPAAEPGPGPAPAGTPPTSPLEQVAPGQWGPGPGPWGPPPGQWGPPPGQWGTPSGQWGTPTGQWPAAPGGQWGGPPPAGHAEAGHGGRFSRFIRSATTAWVVAGVLALVVVGLSWALATAHPTVRVSGPFRGGVLPPAGGFVGPGATGNRAVGTVASVGTGSFTLTTASGQTITVTEQSSTVYYSGGATATSSAVVTGARVAVLGTLNGSTITATRVLVLPAGGLGFGAAGG
ncbi:MAG TPA: hypothetical protein VEI83_11450 [Acidimicrobiales bacterium]|nr:hypothetical protein [Acidimicrobiales bacterium]